MRKDLQELKEIQLKIARLKASISLLHWDQQVWMPKGAFMERANQTATLESILHHYQTGEWFQQKLGVLIDLETGMMKDDSLAEHEKVWVHETWKDYQKEAVLPNDFVEAFARAQSQSFVAWEKAKQNNELNLFAPHLEKIISLSKKKAAYLNPSMPAYDALLDQYEPEMTTEILDPLFASLKKEIGALLHNIQKKGISIPIFKEATYPIHLQEQLTHAIIQELGYAFAFGRQDFSEHPFSMSLHPTDARITTRLNEKDLMSGILASIHECGHALYEQGLDLNWYGTPLGESVSFGIHESQSRLYETRIGLSHSYWVRMYPQLQSMFPEAFADLPFDKFYQILNRVEPSLCRLNADELTYNFHIIIRYEIEKEMMQKTLSTTEIAMLWNEKYQQYLGVQPQTDTDGILQDVHWAEGYIGYFPSYVLGCIYASQLFEQMEKDLKTLQSDIEAGEFKGIRAWLKNHVHQKGRLQTPRALIKDITGKEISVEPYLRYLNHKYKEIYAL